MFDERKICDVVMCENKLMLYSLVPNVEKHFNQDFQGVIFCFVLRNVSQYIVPIEKGVNKRINVLVTNDIKHKKV